MEEKADSIHELCVPV